MSHPEPVARRRYALAEPVGLIPYLADEPNEALTDLLADRAACPHPIPS